MAPLEKYRARAAMEAACGHTAEILRFRPPCIPHAVAVMVMALNFHTKDPDWVRDTLNIILFPDLSPGGGLEAALRTRKWEAILSCDPLNSFVGTIQLMVNQMVVPVAGQDMAVSQLKAWAIFCAVFLGDDIVHPTTYKMFLLLEETSGVSPRLRAQARQKPTFLTPSFS